MTADRGSAMAASVVRTARAFGVPVSDIPLLSRAHALGMARRVATLDDDHHPLYLHPGRGMLVLLRDAEVIDAVVLAAVAVTETEDDAVRVPDGDLRETLGNEIADLVAGVPVPGTESLAEDLVVADERVRLVALAERLDHARHAHMRDDVDDRWRRAILAEARAVYLPVAERTHARLAQRYRHWCLAFARRLE